MRERTQLRHADFLPGKCPLPLQRAWTLHARSEEGTGAGGPEAQRQAMEGMCATDVSSSGRARSAPDQNAPLRGDPLQHPQTAWVEAPTQSVPMADLCPHPVCCNGRPAHPPSLSQWDTRSKPTLTVISPRLLNAASTCAQAKTARVRDVSFAC